MDGTWRARHLARDVAWRRGTMNADTNPVNPTLPPPPDVSVTTLFIKPVYGITVSRNMLAVSVRAHLEDARGPRSAARG